jgi:hypothetical protein
MRKLPSLLVFVLLLAIAHTEIPELLHLSDDVSNDFGATSFGCKSVETRAINNANTPFLGNSIAPAILRTVRVFCFSPATKSFQDAGTRLLYLNSVLRT